MDEFYAIINFRPDFADFQRAREQRDHLKEHQEYAFLSSAATSLGYLGKELAVNDPYGAPGSDEI
jgi:hypothetical protein